MRQEGPIGEWGLAFKINHEGVHALFHVEVQDTGNLAVRCPGNETREGRSLKRWEDIEEGPQEFEVRLSLDPPKDRRDYNMRVGNASEKLGEKHRMHLR